VYRLERLALLDGSHGWAYVCEAGADTTSEGWSVERFAARHLAAYVESCIAWRRRYDATGDRRS
jgi:hypothetical protein